jgi:alpha-methylacyl-CoA racemase
MGPLQGVTVIEIASLGPGPFCAMLLADMGADVVRLERIGDGAIQGPLVLGPLERTRRSMGIDLKVPAGPETVLRMIEQADVVIEGFRPGVAERLGIGPDVCRERNSRLVYGRVTGWGRTGPLANDAGHDIDYLALAGGLHPIGRKGEAPVIPINMVADFGGGGMLLAMGLLAALVERGISGEGQVVDAAMVDGVAIQTALLHGLLAAGLWTDERGVNLLDGGAPFYDVYETADGKHVAVGAIEAQFFDRMIELLGLDPADVPPHLDPASWPKIRSILSDAFARRTRDEWADLFAGEDACVSPVLSLLEAPRHPHNVAREAFVDVGGAVQPSPAPRFSRTGNDPPRPASVPGADTDDVLAGFGFTPDEVAALKSARTVR